MPCVCAAPVSCRCPRLPGPALPSQKCGWLQPARGLAPLERARMTPGRPRHAAHTRKAVRSASAPPNQPAPKGAARQLACPAGAPGLAVMTLPTARTSDGAER
eukprot:scaffold6013_cov210-Isochrysis_galbana.AAC.1